MSKIRRHRLLNSLNYLELYCYNLETNIINEEIHKDLNTLELYDLIEEELELVSTSIMNEKYIEALNSTPISLNSMMIFSSREVLGETKPNLTLHNFEEKSFRDLEYGKKRKKW